MESNYQNSNILKEDIQMPKIKDDKYNIIKNDVEKIQKRPTMYIANLGDLGVFHLCKELVDNSKDECSNTESPGNKIEITMNNKQISIRDNGRGIPITGVRPNTIPTLIKTWKRKMLSTQ